MRDVFVQGLETLRFMAWPEPFEFWRASEGSDPHWRGIARERGFETWEDWRRSYVPHFRMEERRWTLYRVVDPLLTVPGFRGGPFQGWIEKTYRDAGISPTFEVIAGRLTEVQNGYVAKLKASYPKETTVIGVQTDDGVIIAEGTHRCCAIAQAAAEGLPIATDFRIALGSYLPGSLPMIQKVYKGVDSI